MTDTTKKTKKWDDAAVATLLNAVRGMTVVDADTVRNVAAELKVTERSVAAKLRQLDVEVASMAKSREATFSVEQSDALAKLVNDNAGVYTYKELAEVFPGEFSAKQIQGKLLALELTGKVKPAEKVEVARLYTPAQEAKFVELANGGAFIEDIASELGFEIASVRGKALSLSRSGQISNIPKQREAHGKVIVDPIAALGDKLATMTVADIAKSADRTERGIRTLLTRRGLKAADYDGAAKKAKALAKAEPQAAA